jgi:hypothetical protein
VRSFFGAWIAAAITFGNVPSASAENPSLFILGIRSAEGDDEFANELTAALRAQAAKLEKWQTSQRSISLDQMSLAYSCDDIDAACLSKIASGIGATRIIYGASRRSSARETYDFVVTLSFFDADAGAIEGSATKIISSLAASGSALESSAAALLSELVIASSSGANVAIRSNVGAAEVMIDGNFAGRLENGALVISDVTPGERQFEIAAAGYESYRRKVAVTKGERITIAGSLNPVRARVSKQSRTKNEEKLWSNHVPTWVPYTFLGVSGASLAGMVVSWVWINSIENDQIFRDYRTRVGMNSPGVNVCDEAKRGLAYAASGSPEYGTFSDVQKMCGRAGTLEILQFVFLGAAVVSGGVGAFLLLTQTKPHDKEVAINADATAPVLSIQPYLGRHLVGVGTLVVF